MSDTLVPILPGWLLVPIFDTRVPVPLRGCWEGCSGVIGCVAMALLVLVGVVWGDGEVVPVVGLSVCDDVMCGVCCWGGVRWDEG